MLSIHIIVLIGSLLTNEKLNLLLNQLTLL
jgi:hypothetical protein